MVAEAQTPTNATPTIPDVLPVLPLHGMVVFPLAVVPLSVGQERSIRLVDDAMQRDRMLTLVASRPEAPEAPLPEHLYRVGTAAMIHQLARTSDGVLRIVVQGIERVRIEDFVSVEPYITARVVPAPDGTAPNLELDGLRRALVDLYRRLVAIVDDLPGELVGAAESLPDARQVAYLVASTAPLPMTARQEILELEPVDEKLRRLVDLLQHELAVRELGQRITAETQERMSKTQRDYYLREQLRAIQRELGENEGEPELQELRERLQTAGLAPEARKEAERELARLATIPPASPEHGMIRTYLDWLLSVPWSRLSGGEIDVRRARAVLDEDHYDLEKVKDRILEYLAVRKLRQERLNLQVQDDVVGVAGVGEVDPTPEPNTRAETDIDRSAREPILCFVGPPGVGKTSLGQSIARALGRRFVRISLGGVHDEAEIRGHRRTYIGAMPGRIIQAIRRSETLDPVFMLDEIDKVGSDWRGDPSSALLEVLDPAQNHSFVDNYLGVPVDLSQVLFITTANALASIPLPLQDRMEVLQLAGYTDDEKIKIAERYLIPKQLRAHGLTTEEVAFEPEAIREIVRGYTREAGVRNLDREIAAICRKVARDIAEGKTGSVQLTRERVGAYLGRVRFVDEVADRVDRPGVATGLAWTPVGGDVLFIEATMIASGNERLVLTGMLGDVMRESAQAALSYVRSNAEALGMDGDAFKGKIVHVHVPAGAIPKDGPSAGVTIMTALASLASERVVRPDVAMTGEITLRGKVLPVGGIKEKVLAAHRTGLRTIILPRRNEADLEDIPVELRKELRFVLADTAEDVLRHAFGSPEKIPDESHAQALSGSDGIGERIAARPRKTD